MSNTKIKVSLKRTPYTNGGPIATGILKAISRLGNIADTITSIKLTDSKSRSEFGYGLRFQIVIEIPSLISKRINVTKDYLGSKMDVSEIANFIECRCKGAIHSEITRLKKTIEELGKSIF